jgi:hypothetical protein
MSSCTTRKVQKRSALHRLLAPLTAQTPLLNPLLQSPSAIAPSSSYPSQHPARLNDAPYQASTPPSCHTLTMLMAKTRNAFPFKRRGNRLRRGGGRAVRCVERRQACFCRVFCASKTRRRGLRKISTLPESLFAPRACVDCPDPTPSLVHSFCGKDRASCGWRGFIPGAARKGESGWGESGLWAGLPKN